MTARDYYIQFATSLAEEWAVRWLPFTALGLVAPQWLVLFGTAFGLGHWFVYKDVLKMLLVIIFGGLLMNWLYAIWIPAPWNFVAVIGIHFAARLAGRYIKL